MAQHTWGPVEKPAEHNVRGIASAEEGAVTEPHPANREAAPHPAEDYDATDGRHTKADHQGWPSIDGNSGEGVGSDGRATRRFPDGPGRWRQT
jgi:hypothetical protein